MTCLNSVPIGALLKNKDVQLPHEPNTLFRGAPWIKYFEIRSHWVSGKPFLKLFLEASRHIESPLSWKLEQLNLFWQVVCLAIIWLGTDENIAFGTKQILPSLHDVSSVNHKKKTIESSAFGISVAWYSWKHTFARPNKSYLQNMLCQPQKALETSVFGIGVACNSCKRSSGNE